MAATATATEMEATATVPTEAAAVPPPAILGERPPPLRTLPPVVRSSFAMVWGRPEACLPREVGGRLICEVITGFFPLERCCVGYEGMLGMFVSVVDFDWYCESSGFNGSCELLGSSCYD